MTYLENIGENAKKATRTLAIATTEQKNEALSAIAKALINNQEKILDANKIDIENGKNNGLNESLLDRLSLSPERIKGIADSILDVINLDDPIGRTLSETERPNGLKIARVTVPLGVIAVIYEARPNVTADAAVLCFKSGNVVILRGGKEAINSNKAIAETMRNAITELGFDKNCIQLIEDTSRETATELMRLNKYVDVLIPRGGAGLINSVVKNSTVPVIETGVGNCHIYVDKDANIDMASSIIFNAKTSRPSVCNACESLLIHKDIAELSLLAISEKLKEKDVKLFGDEITCSIIPYAQPATEDDWGREYLDYALSVKVVDNIDEAIDHITKYGTNHSECILTENAENAEKFLNEVDAAAVYLNASTRFTDGGEFGLGAEIGISTQKLHARGPLGLNELTSFKYKVRGTGQIR